MATGGARATVATATAWLLVAGSLGGCLLSGKLDGLTGGAAASDGGADGADGADGATDASSGGVTDGSVAEGGSVPDAGACPGTAGPTPVRVGSYCIDSTEVTNAQYQSFLDARAGDVSGQASYCAWNDNLTPATTASNPWPAAPAQADFPVVLVDWCDASAYCRWAGKRLCGRIGGGSLGPSDQASATKSQWFAACSRGGALPFPYGNAYSAGVCNGSSQASRAVAADTACAGGYPGVFDMSGNVEEWQDACSAQSGPSDACGLQGGDWEDTRSGLDCAGSARTDNRSYAWKSRGIRCCSDP